MISDCCKFLAGDFLENFGVYHGLQSIYIDKSIVISNIFKSFKLPNLLNSLPQKNITLYI